MTDPGLELRKIVNQPENWNFSAADRLYVGVDLGTYKAFMIVIDENGKPRAARMQRAEVVRSGEPQRIIDIGRHLRLGNNDIQIRSNSAGGGGGSLYVYLGTGSDRSGTVVMDEPAVQYGLGASRTGPFERSYTLQVQ